jgi:sigma-B regulation protein RsbU (phosphoserine phosphatase)
MAMASSAFRLLAEGSPEPQRIVSRINESMVRKNDLSLFITYFVGMLDLETGHLRYCNAGHSAPFVNGKPIPVDTNLPIGVMANWEFTVQETDLTPGDTLFLYTDGLDEAENDQLELFGKQRINDILQASSSLSPRALIERMTKAVSDFVGDTEQSDDLTMFAIQWKK